MPSAMTGPSPSGGFGGATAGFGADIFAFSGFPLRRPARSTTLAQAPAPRRDDAMETVHFNYPAFLGAKATLAFGVFAGFATGLGWVAMSLGIVYLFEQRSLKLWLVNGGCQV